ncbi:MAG: hypothetical protein AB9834_01705 [Lentimicrobium sp.]
MKKNLRSGQLIKCSHENKSFLWVWPGKLAGIVLLFLLFPDQLAAQFLESTIHIKEAISEKKVEYIGQLKITGSLENNKIIIVFEPVYEERDIKSDKKKIIKDKKVAGLDLRFDLKLDKIIPDGYINNPIKDIGVYEEEKKVEYELSVNNPTKDLQFVFVYKLTKKDFKNTEEAKSKALILKCTNQSADQDSEVSSAEISKGQQEEKKKGGGGKDPKQKTTSVSDTTIGLGGMERLLADYRKLYANIYEKWSGSKDTITYGKEDIDQYKDELRGCNERSDELILYYIHVPQAESYNKLFTAYKEYIGGLLTGLGTVLEQSDKLNSTKKENAISQERNKNKTLATLLIILGAILMAILIYFVLIKIQKKVKQNFQKKMKRKAELELNKQKFKVTRPENKLKL